MRYRYVLSLAAITALFACDDTPNEQAAELREEAQAERIAEAQGKDVIDQEIEGEIAERRGQLARDVGAEPDTMKDPTTCDEVYKHAVALDKGADGLVDGQSEIPERDPFMQVCEKLPQKVRACMSVSYAYHHGSECREALEQLDPPLREELDRVAKR